MEQIRSQALAEMALAPYVQDGAQVNTPDTAVAAFDAWLEEVPEALDRDDDENELRTLIGVR